VQRIDQGMYTLCLFYEWRGRYQEGESACRLAEKALTVSGDPSSASVPGDRIRVLATAVIWRAAFAQARHRVDHVIPLLERALGYLVHSEAAGVDVRREKAFALKLLGDTSYDAGREDARQWYEQSLDLYRELDEPAGIAWVLHHLGGQVLGSGGDFERGEALVRESLAIRQSLGDQRGIALSRRGLGIIMALRGEVEEFVHLLTQSLATFQAVGDPVDTADTRTTLAYGLLFLGRPDEAYAQATKSLEILGELGVRDALTAQTYKTAGDALLWMGKHALARPQAETAVAIAREIGNQHILAMCLRTLGQVEIVDENYACAERILREGAAAVGRIRHYQTYTCSSLAGLAVLRQGRLDRARRYLYDGLATALEQGAYLPIAYGLPLAAALLLDAGQVERAVELYALALQQPFVASSRWYEQVVGRQIAAAAETLPPEVAAAARARGRARDLKTTIRELVFELEGRG
jgi:tetratricopeptide (TPR) repeat protein